MNQDLIELKANVLVTTDDAANFTVNAKTLKELFEFIDTLQKKIILKDQLIELKNKIINKPIL